MRLKETARKRGRLVIKVQKTPKYTAYTAKRTEVHISLNKNRHKMPAKNRMWEEKESGKYCPTGFIPVPWK